MRNLALSPVVSVPFTMVTLAKNRPYTERTIRVLEVLMQGPYSAIA